MKGDNHSKNIQTSEEVFSISVALILLTIHYTYLRDSLEMSEIKTVCGISSGLCLYINFYLYRKYPGAIIIRIYTFIISFIFGTIYFKKYIVNLLTTDIPDLQRYTYIIILENNLVIVIIFYCLMLFFKKKLMNYNKLFKITLSKKFENVLFSTSFTFIVIGLLINIYFFLSIGIPFLTTDHFTFRSRVGSNLALATMSRWMTSFGSFILLYSFLKNQKKRLAFFVFIVVFIMNLFIGSRTQTLILVLPLLFMYFYYTQKNNIIVKRIHKVLIWSTLFVSVFVLELVRVKDSFSLTLTSRKNQYLYFLNDFGFLNQVLTVDSLISNTGSTNFLSNRDYIQEIFTGFLPGFLLKLLDMSKTEEASMVFERILPTGNKLGVGIAYINELYLIKNSIFLPTIFYILVFYILLKCELFMSKLYFINKNTFFGVLLTSILFISIIQLTLQGPGTFFYFLIYLYLIPIYLIKTFNLF